MMKLKHTIAYLFVLTLSTAFIYGLFALAAWEINIANWHWIVRTIYVLPQGYILYKLTLFYLESLLKNK